MQEGTAAGPSSILGCSPGQELQFVQKFANGVSLMNMSPRPSGWGVPDRVLRESARLHPWLAVLLLLHLVWADKRHSPSALSPRCRMMRASHG